MLSLEAHIGAILKIFNEAHVTYNIRVNQFDEVVANISVRSCLGFNNDELPQEGHVHNKALHISVKFQDSLLSRVLVDTSSSMNILHKNIIEKLNTVKTSMNASTLVVRTFDGSKRMVIGEDDLPIMVGLHIFFITFQVMDINLSYICLLE